MEDKENKSKTWMDLAREIFPSATQDKLDYILWEHTCFPFGSVEQVKDQLKDYKNELNKLDMI